MTTMTPSNFDRYVGGVMVLPWENYHRRLHVYAITAILPCSAPSAWPKNLSLFARAEAHRTKLEEAAWKRIEGL